jgi:hypothetical protein
VLQSPSSPQNPESALCWHALCHQVWAALETVKRQHVLWLLVACVCWVKYMRLRTILYLLERWETVWDYGNMSTLTVAQGNKYLLGNKAKIGCTERRFGGKNLVPWNVWTRDSDSEKRESPRNRHSFFDYQSRSQVSSQEELGTTKFEERNERETMW